jgi:thiol:disulfide interchange protein DsbD
MACNDVSCIFPEPANFEFKVEGAANPAVADNKVADTVDSAALKAAADSLKMKSADTTQNAGTITGDSGNPVAGRSMWGLFIFAFLMGLAAIITPCVFPMIPMTVSFFMKGSEYKRKARFQAMFYGLSIVAIYTIPIALLIIISYMFGKGAVTADIFNWLSTHWFPNILFFLVFVLFAASFLGMFEIVMPSWLVNKMDSKVDKGGFWGPFFMAFVLVLISFSCTGPIVGWVVVESSTGGGQIIKPIIAMLGFSIAFALPFTFFAFFPSLLQRLPKSGGWLNSVKIVLGFIELAFGFKFLSVADQTYHWGILDREIYLAIWIVISGLLGLYLIGKLTFSHDSEQKRVSVPRLALAIIAFTFMVYLIPGMFGAPLKALSGYLPPQSTHDFDLNAIIRDNANIGKAETAEVCSETKYNNLFHLPHGLKGYFDFVQGVECAKQQNKPIFIDFTGHGCVNCREMEANVWSDPQVLKLLREKFVIVTLYVDDKTDLPENEWVTSLYDGNVKKTIGKKYADFQISWFNVNAQPYYVLFDPFVELNEKASVEKAKLVQPKAYDLNAGNFVTFLNNGLSEFNRRHGAPVTK